MEKNKTIIGSEEWCEFPELGIPAVLARVDSGAKTSSIHAFNIQKFKKGGKSWVSFEVHPLQNDRKITVRCERPIFDKRSIKSSSGIAETRYVIKTLLNLANQLIEIELTLANRDSMGFRMLLGREAMHGKMVIDPSLKNNTGDISPEVLNHIYSKKSNSEKGLTIGLIANEHDLYGNKRLIEAGEDRGHEMKFYDIKQCYMKLDAFEPEIHYRGSSLPNDLDAVITNIQPDMTFYGCALVRQFESMGILTLNSSSSIRQSRDKLYSLQLMLKHRLAIPTTGFANSPIDTGDLIEMVGGAPLIIKLLDGIQGRSAVLAETKNAAESVIHAFKSLNVNLLVQEFIKEADGKELRLLVIDNKVVATIQRELKVDVHTLHSDENHPPRVVKPTLEEKALAIKATKVHNLTVASVDLIRSKNEPLILSINSTPELEELENATSKDIASMIITTIEKKLKWKKELGDVNLKT